MVVCQEMACKPSETCSLLKGVRRCVPKSRSICVATGDPHYTTFDGRRFDFMGTCAYRLVALCSDDPTLVPFVVTVENNNRGSRVVSYTKEITLEVYNVSLSLSQEHPKKLKVGEEEVVVMGVGIGRRLGGLQGPCMGYRWTPKVLLWCLDGFQGPFMVFRWVPRYFYGV